MLNKIRPQLQLFSITFVMLTGPFATALAQPAQTNGKLHTTVIGMDGGANREVCNDSHEGVATIDDVLNRGTNCSPILLKNSEMKQLEDGCSNSENWFGPEPCKIIASGVKAIKAEKDGKIREEQKRLLIENLNAFASTTHMQVHPGIPAWQELIHLRSSRISQADQDAQADSFQLVQAEIDYFRHNRSFLECDGEACRKGLREFTWHPGTELSFHIQGTNVIVRSKSKRGSGQELQKFLELETLEESAKSAPKSAQ